MSEQNTNTIHNNHSADTDEISLKELIQKTTGLIF